MRVLSRCCVVLASLLSQPLTFVSASDYDDAAGFGGGKNEHNIFAASSSKSNNIVSLAKLQRKLSKKTSKDFPPPTSLPPTSSPPTLFPTTTTASAEQCLVTEDYHGALMVLYEHHEKNKERMIEQYNTQTNNVFSANPEEGGYTAVAPMGCILIRDDTFDYERALRPFVGQVNNHELVTKPVTHVEVLDLFCPNYNGLDIMDAAVARHGVVFQPRVINNDVGAIHVCPEDGKPIIDGDECIMAVIPLVITILDIIMKALGIFGLGALGAPQWWATATQGEDKAVEMYTYGCDIYALVNDCGGDFTCYPQHLFSIVKHLVQDFIGGIVEFVKFLLSDAAWYEKWAKELGLVVTITAAILSDGASFLLLVLAMIGDFLALPDEIVNLEKECFDNQDYTAPPTPSDKQPNLICEVSMCGETFTGDKCQITCPVGIPLGYYPDVLDCSAYCYCSGTEAPGRYEKCADGLYWDSLAGDATWLQGVYGRNETGTSGSYTGMFGTTGGTCNYPDQMNDENKYRPPFSCHAPRPCTSDSDCDLPSDVQIPGTPVCCEGTCKLQMNCATSSF